MRYRIHKYNPKTKEWENYSGGYTEEDVKMITKCYKNDGLFYTRKRSKVIFEVVEQ